ncbi:MAG: hypothetical protein C0442_06350, partial [Chlorobiaceae bacterium]|nr:hypothetical protein [Chlorobiaceae bacterium]
KKRSSKNIQRTIFGLWSDTIFRRMVKSLGICVNLQTLRKWLRAEVITTSMRKQRPHRKKREKHSCFGELLQFDGSHHDWFEGRGAECCLINCVDDSPGKVYLKFAISEKTQDVLLTLWEYVNKYGIPRSIYTDKQSVYKGEGNLTDFGRAIKELNIETIFANKPGKKGYKLHLAPKDHPWRRMNQKIREDKERNFFSSVLG